MKFVYHRVRRRAKFEKEAYAKERRNIMKIQKRSLQMKSKKTVLIVLLVLMTLSMAAPLFAAENGSPARPEKLFDFRRITLDNGLQVITLEDFSTPIVAVQVWYHVGSKNEDPQRQGFAHMFEHMMFKGTDVVGPRDHFELLRKVGSNTNGYTSFDKTVYLETLPADQLELALWLEAERMAFLKIDQEAFDTERNVVEEELRMSENEPYGNVYKKIAAALFQEHPYRWTPIGKLAHLRAASVQELRDFWADYYVPNNATLLIVGAVKHEEAQVMAEKYFGWIKKRPQAKRVTVVEPEPREARTLVIDDELAPAPLTGIVWRTVPHGHKDEVPLDFLARLIGEGSSSLLYRDLVADKQAAVEVTGWTYNLEQDGVFVLGAMVSPTGDEDTVLDSIQSAVEKIRKDGITKEQLEKARNHALKSVSMETLTVEGKATVLGTAAVVLGDPNRANDILERIEAVTTEDVRRVADEYLVPRRSLTVKVRQNMEGSKDDETATVTAATEAQAPAPGRAGERRPAWFPSTAPIREVRPVDVTPEYFETKLDNDLKVIVVSNRETPFVSVMFGLPYGAWNEAGPGTASLALSMLTRGTDEYSEAELAEYLESKAIRLEGSAQMDTSTVSMNCLPQFVEYGVNFMAEVILHPAFPADEFAKLQKQTATALRVQEQSPEYKADTALRKALFGPHPYARPQSGRSEDIEALTVEDVRTYWQTFAQPQSGTLIFAGDITPERAVALAKQAFGKWKNETPLPKLTLPDIPEPSEQMIYLINQPASSQAQIRVGQRGITRHDQPEYFISRIVGSYFGGSFNSRLNETLRVNKGLTYGAFAGFTTFKRAGWFVVDTFTRTQAADESIRTIFELLEDLARTPPSDAELNDSKTYFSGSFLRQRETPQQVAQDIWLVESQNLTKTYYNKLYEGILRTTKEDCVKLVKDLLHPDKMTIVVVGSAEELKAPLEAIAPVVVIE